MPQGTPPAGADLDSGGTGDAERWARRPKTAQALAQRARIVLGAAEGRPNKVVAAMAAGHPSRRSASGARGSSSDAPRRPARRAAARGAAHDRRRRRSSG